MDQLDQECKTTKINALRARMNKADSSSQTQPDNVDSEMEISGKSQAQFHRMEKEKKTTVTEMNSTVDGTISQLDRAEQNL